MYSSSWSWLASSNRLKVWGLLPSILFPSEYIYKAVLSQSSFSVIFDIMDQVAQIRWGEFDPLGLSYRITFIRCGPVNVISPHASLRVDVASLSPSCQKRLFIVFKRFKFVVICHDRLWSGQLFVVWDSSWDVMHVVLPIDIRRYCFLEWSIIHHTCSLQKLGVLWKQ